MPPCSPPAVAPLLTVCCVQSARCYARPTSGALGTGRLPTTGTLWRGVVACAAVVPNQGRRAKGGAWGVIGYPQGVPVSVAGVPEGDANNRPRVVIERLPLMLLPDLVRLPPPEDGATRWTAVPTCGNGFTAVDAT